MSNEETKTPDPEQVTGYLVPADVMAAITQFLAKQPLAYPDSQPRDQLLAWISQQRPIEVPTDEHSG